MSGSLPKSGRGRWASSESAFLTTSWTGVRRLDSHKRKLMRTAWVTAPEDEFFQDDENESRIHDFRGMSSFRIYVPKPLRTIRGCASNRLARGPTRLREC